MRVASLAEETLDHIELPVSRRLTYLYGSYITFVLGADWNASCWNTGPNKYHIEGGKKNG